MNIMFGNESIETTCSELNYSAFENMERAINDMPVLSFFGLENLMELCNDTDIENLYKIIEEPGCENYEDFPINVYNNEFVAGVEGIVWDTISTTGKAVKGAVKTVHAAHKFAYRQVNNMKLNWAQNIKPLIIKILKEFQAQLSIMWGKFRKYDQLYVKLGKEINTVINVYGKQLENLPNIKLFYHKFNAKLLRGFAEAIGSYEAYMGAIKGAPDLFNGNFVEPVDFAEIVKSGDTTKAKNVVDAMSAGMQKLNQRGDLSIAFAMMNDATKNSGNNAWSKIKNFFVDVDNDRILRVAIKNKTPLVQFIQIAILRNEVEKTYNASNVNVFKADMLDRNDSYLPVLSTILNRKVLQTVLERGATSIKKETSEEMSEMENIVKVAQDELNARTKKENNERLDKEKEEKNRQRNDVTGGTGNGNGSGSGNNGGNGNDLNKEVENAENNTDNLKEDGSSSFNLYDYFFGTEDDGNKNAEFFKPEKDNSAADNGNPGTNNDNSTAKNDKPDGTPDNMGMPELCAAYVQTYSIFMSKCTAGYSSIVKGVLAATFTLCKEADTIVNAIYDAAGAKRDEATKSFINNDENAE